MFLYGPGNGHLFDRTSPDAPQRRPDLYLEYARTLLSTLRTLANRIGLPASQIATTGGLEQIARMPSSNATRWYKWEGFEDDYLNDLTIDRLRSLILVAARARGIEPEVRRLMSYRPELSTASGMTAAGLDRQVRSAVGEELTPKGISGLMPAGSR